MQFPKEIPNKSYSPHPTVYLLNGCLGLCGKGIPDWLCGRLSCLCRPWILHFFHWSASCTCRKEKLLKWWKVLQGNLEQDSSFLKVLNVCFIIQSLFSLNTGLSKLSRESFQFTSNNLEFETKWVYYPYSWRAHSLPSPCNDLLENVSLVCLISLP